MKNIVTDIRILNAMIRRGYIKEATYTFLPYVDEGEHYNGVFEYKENKYKLKYFDGSFYPLVEKLNND